MAGKISPKCYTAYGAHLDQKSSILMSAFNGELWHSAFDGYCMGNGYRIFNPARMRFNSPDEASPFGKGSINTYAYCGGDPVNFTDPTGMSRTQYFLHRFMPKPKPNNALQPQSSRFFSDIPSLRPSKDVRARKFLTLRNLKEQIDFNHYNDYSDAQLGQKALRFSELLAKEDARAKNNSIQTSKHFQAVSRYRNNIDAIEHQYSMRYPDDAFQLSEQGKNFWEKSQSEIPMYSTASDGALRVNDHIKRIRSQTV